MNLSEAYLHALAWGLPADFIVIALLEVIIGIGEARVILLFTIISVALNIFCSYVLIFGKFGFQAYGIAGAGWGMTVSYALTLVILASFIWVIERYRQYFSYIFSLDRPFFLWELLQVGVPMGIMYCVEVAFFFALTLFMGLFGSQIQAANQVVLQYLGLFMSAIFSIAQAVTVRMGHLLGAKNIIATERASYVGIIIAVSFTIMVGIIYWFFPLWLIAVDFDVRNPNNANIVSHIKTFFAVSAIFQILEAARITLFGSLRGLKDTNFTLLTSIISFWGIAAPLGYFFAIYLKFAGVGFWMGMAVGAGLSVFLLQWRFKHKIALYYKYQKVAQL